MRQVTVYERVQRDGQWQTIEKGTANFHQFGVDYEEFENGPGNFSTAIIEWPDGKVENVPVWLVQFVVASGDSLKCPLCGALVPLQPDCAEYSLVCPNTACNYKF